MKDREGCDDLSHGPWFTIRRQDDGTFVVSEHDGDKREIARCQTWEETDRAMYLHSVKSKGTA
jgi:hypothetical protein